jgi:hypothetical protein
VLGLSVLCEAFEYAVGWRARWLIDSRRLYYKGSSCGGGASLLQA